MSQNRRTPSPEELKNICRGYLNGQLDEQKFRRVFGNALEAFFRGSHPNAQATMVVRAGIPGAFSPQYKFPNAVWKPQSIARTFIQHMDSQLPAPRPAPSTRTTYTRPTPQTQPFRANFTTGPPRVVTAEARNFLGLTMNDEPSQISECIKLIARKLASAGTPHQARSELALVKQHYESLLQRRRTGQYGAGRRQPKQPKTFYLLLETRLTTEMKRINELTRQAQVDGKQPALAKSDVRAICKFIRNKQADQRLAALFLIDSICRQVKGHFLDLFEPEIHGIFVSSFKYGGPKIREKIKKILKMWKDARIFPISVLQTIHTELCQHAGKPAPLPPRANGSSLGSRKVYQTAPNGTLIDVTGIFSKLQVAIQGRSELRPHLETLRNKAMNGYDVTEEIMGFYKRVTTPSAAVLAHKNLASTIDALAATLNLVEDVGTKKKSKQPICKDWNSPQGCRNLNCAFRHAKAPKSKEETSLEQRDKVVTSEDGRVSFWSLLTSERHIKKLKKTSLSLLYSRRLEICPICGIRMEKSKLHGHLDMHFRENQRDKALATKAKYRHWYLQAEDWLNDKALGDRALNPFMEKDENEEKKGPKVEKRVPKNDDHPQCAACREAFETVFDEKADEWMFRNAVYADGSHGASGGRSRGKRGREPAAPAVNKNVILHARCYADLAEERKRAQRKDRAEAQRNKNLLAETEPPQRKSSLKIMPVKKHKKKHKKTKISAPKPVLLRPVEEVLKNKKPPPDSEPVQGPELPPHMREDPPPTNPATLPEPPDDGDGMETDEPEQTGTGLPVPSADTPSKKRKLSGSTLDTNPSPAKLQRVKEEPTRRAPPTFKPGTTVKEERDVKAEPVKLEPAFSDMAAKTVEELGLPPVPSSDTDNAPAPHPPNPEIVDLASPPSYSLGPKAQAQADPNSSTAVALRTGPDDEGDGQEGKTTDVADLIALQAMQPEEDGDGDGGEEGDPTSAQQPEEEEEEDEDSSSDDGVEIILYN